MPHKRGREIMTRDRIGYSRRSILKKGALTTSALVLGGVAGTGTAAAGLGDGRVGHYPLNNLKGRGKTKTTVHDASPYGNDGTNNGAEVVKDGPVGNAFAFDGTDDYVIVPEDGSLDLQEELTISFWFRLDGTSDDNAYPRAVSKGQSTTQNGAYGVFIEDGNGVPDRIGLRFHDENDTKYDIENRSLDRYDDDQWHHVAATYSNPDDTGRLYFDNRMAADVTISGDVSIRTTDDNLRLGDGNGDRHLNGRLDEVRIYKRALSSEEVTELYEMREGSRFL